MFIRSTYSSRLNFLSRQTSKVTNELSQVNEQAATGKQINRLSDAPFKGSLLHNLRHAISEQKEYQRAANSSVSLQYSIRSAFTMKTFWSTLWSLQSSFQMTHTMQIA